MLVLKSFLCTLQRRVSCCSSIDWQSCVCSLSIHCEQEYSPTRMAHHFVSVLGFWHYEFLDNKYMQLVFRICTCGRALNHVVLIILEKHSGQKDRPVIFILLLLFLKDQNLVLKVFHNIFLSLYYLDVEMFTSGLSHQLKNFRYGHVFI